MRIAYYIHYLSVGGAEKIVVEYLKRLKKLGHEVILVVNEPYNSLLSVELEDAGIDTFPLIRHSRQNRRFIKMIPYIIERKTISYKNRWEDFIKVFKPDIIHIHTVSSTLSDVPFPTKKLFFTFHSDVNRAFKNASNKASEFLKNNASKEMCFIALNKLAAENIKKELNTNNIYIIPNGIDVKEIRAKNRDSSVLRKKYGFNNNAFLVGHVGRFHPVKNHEKIISVFNEIRKKNPSAELVLVGQYDSQRYNIIKQMAIQYGLLDYIYFMGVRSDVIDIMSCFDVFIFPSLSEAFPVSLLEAQALGIKIVASDVVENECIYNPNVSKLSVDASDIEWANTVLDENIVNTNTAGCDLLELDLDTIVDKLIQLYRKAL